MRAPRSRGRATGALAALALATAPLLPALAPQAPLEVAVTPAAWPAAAASFVSAAHRSVDVALYELDDPATEDALAADAARGVRVRVLLDSAYGGRRHNASAVDWLEHHGVAVRWAWPTVILHEKAVVVDGQVAAVMTANLVAREYSDTRDVVVLDRRSLDVATIEQVFASDWAGGRPTRFAGRRGDLVLSPDAMPTCARLVARAQRTVLIETEELTAPTIVGALVGAARRGVRVEVVMTTGNLGVRVAAELERAGVRVVERPAGTLYIHAKVLVVDAGTGRPSEAALVGSQNLSATSLDVDRELGVLVTDPTAVDRLARTVSGDAAG